MTLSARNASPGLLASCHDFEPPRARATGLGQVPHVHRSVHAGLVCASQSRAREMARGRKNKKCPFAKKYIWYIVMQAPPFRMRVVGRTHTIVRLQTRIRRKDGTENFGGFVFVLDGFAQRDFVLWVLCAHLISVSFPATTPRATTPHRYLTATTPRATTPVQIHSS